ncbi:hypothetical protein CJP72_17540 [Citrobacter sp. NCU1]|uniref:hypothetical protein n=1 Tax=Citrobacter sp. NCU1 TaxID=2026683 RepID=UPI0013907001|nr:hypothetical protein [Citrobacter sp. NCU1]NDO82515.1 hypothetical protein [Citrobacter sp. NCU1]
MKYPTTLLPLIKKDIHFDALFAQAEQQVKRYGGQIWSDIGEHDPGITFLEGFSYSVSDLAYRNTLPLVDLLTPPLEQQTVGDGIFPQDFGPQTALTCSPVTLDDYRRALLDLTDSSESYYLFRNVQLLPLNSDETAEANAYDYRYYYNTDNQQFSFVVPVLADASKSVPFVLRGNYALYLEPSREVKSHESDAQTVLDVFLADHRNLGEKISKQIWVNAQEINPVAVVELADGVQDYSAIFAQIYTITENYISPQAQHVSTAELITQGMLADDIYQGPYLAHGWLPELPPDKDYSTKISVDLVGLAELWVAIDGVKSIISLQEYSTQTWDWSTSASNSYPQLWGVDPLNQIAKSVQLVTADGTYVTASKEDIAANIAPLVIEKNPAVVLPYGQPRNTAQYHPVSDKLPACYGLQQLPAASSPQTQLYQFLLPFEQAMANGCQQLALLPHLLSFLRSGRTVWGGQWPYAAGSVGDQVHSAYKSALVDQITAQANDEAQELTLLNYLLGYFGTSRASRMLDTSSEEYLNVEQHYLGQISTLTYQRDNIRIDQVSSLQKRVAARMGLGECLFDQQVDMSKLPFYLVEHRELLPERPSPLYDALTLPTSVVVSADSTLLTVTSPISLDLTEMHAGQLINFVLRGGLGINNDTSDFMVQALIVNSVDVAAHAFTLVIADNPQMQIYLQQILTAQSNGKLFWQNCQVWLQDVLYPLNYAAGTENSPRAPVTLTIPAALPFPALVREGDILSIDAIQTITGQAWSMRVEVKSIDGIAGSLTVDKAMGETKDFPAPSDTGNYLWHNTKVFDRFSFLVSLVLNKAMLPDNCDRTMTETWIKQCLQAEMPAHVSLVIHWLEESGGQQSFTSFARNYAVWQNKKTAPSTATYQLLWQLGIGVLPMVRVGIGSMIIATDDQRKAVIGESGDEWNIDVIVDDGLFFVPQRYTS